MPVVRDVLASIRNHVAPVGRGGVDAQAQEAQAGFGKDGDGDADGDADQQRADGVGQEVTQGDGPPADPHGPRRFDKLHIAQRQELRARETAERDPVQ